MFALIDPLVAPIAVRAAFWPQRPTPGFRRAYPTALTTQPAAIRQDGRDIIAVSAGAAALSRGYAGYPVPVHVLFGARDKVLPPGRHARRLVRALGPAARQSELGRGGHMIHHLAADRILAAVEDVRSRAAGRDE